MPRNLCMLGQLGRQKQVGNILQPLSLCSTCENSRNDSNISHSEKVRCHNFEWIERFVIFSPDEDLGNLLFWREKRYQLECEKNVTWPEVSLFLKDDRLGMRLRTGFPPAWLSRPPHPAISFIHCDCPTPTQRRVAKITTEMKSRRGSLSCNLGNLPATRTQFLRFVPKIE